MHQNSNCFYIPVEESNPRPFVANLDAAARRHASHHTMLWKGHNLQLCLICVPVDGETGLQVCSETDQIFQVVCGNGMVLMGPSKNRLNDQQPISAGYAAFIPAKTWHNIRNTGPCPLKICTIHTLSHP